MPTSANRPEKPKFTEKFAPRDFTSEFAADAEEIIAGPGDVNNAIGEAFGKELTDFNLMEMAGAGKTIKATLFKEKFKNKTGHCLTRMVWL